MNRTRRRGQAGYTMIELMIALVIGLVVLYALGRIILTNQKSWEYGRDKVVLQQNVTEALFTMTGAIRGADSVVVVDSSQFKTFDAHALVHTYRRVVSGGTGRLQQDGTDLVARACSRFNVTPNADTTCMVLTVALQDNQGEQVVYSNRVTLRGRTFAY